MTRTITFILALGLSAPLMAQEPTTAPDQGDAKQVAAQTPAQPAAASQTPAPATDAVVMPPSTRFATRNVVIGVGGRDEQTNSSKFMEYRSYPNGAVLPYLRFFGEDKVLYDISARNALQDDAWYGLRLEKGWFGLRGQFTKVPHIFGNGAVSVLQDMGNGEFRIPDALQQQNQATIDAAFAKSKPSVNFAFLNNLATGMVNGTERMRVGLQRDRGSLDLDLTRDQPVDVKLAYTYEDRSGSRGSGTAFGFGNVVETPEPIDYRTHDIALSAEWSQKWGLLRGGLRFNMFDNKIPVQTFDNPFRATDSTDASAYQAPGSASVAGASFARIALPPSNDSITGALGFTVKFAGNSRLSADASYGQWTQDESFIPFTTNTAITAPFRATDRSFLPAQSLDGRIDTATLAAMFTTRPVKGLNLTARYRRYDLDNKTPRLDFAEGYVRFDGVWEDIPRVNVPYGYTNDNAQVTASYDFPIGDQASLGVEGGYKYDRMDRTFRETAHTSQNSVFGSLHVRTSDWLILRGTVEYGTRDYHDLEIELSEEASFLEAGVPANLLAVPAHSSDINVQKSFASLGCKDGVPCNLRYDQAAKTLWRANGLLQVMPGGNTSVSLSYTYGQDDYDETRYGLVNSKNWAFNAEADYTPSERFNIFALYGREDIRSFLRGRQSGSLVSFDPRDDWTSDSKDIVDTLGGGLTVGIVKDKADLSVFGTYQKVNGNNDLAAVSGGLAELAKRPLGGVLGIANYDDTKLISISSEVGYKLDKAWKLSLGGIYEDYTLDDAFSTGLSYYMPASFFLNGNDGNYRAGSLYLRVSYLW
jgi:MtrB/PioB family decaheme-associated outer membrane protein